MLKYSQLNDYILGVLYNFKKNKQTGYFSLSEIAKNLDYTASYSEILDIGKYLEAEGYVKANFSLGEVFIELTVSGVVYLEDKPEKFTENFDSYITKHKLDTKTVSKFSMATVLNSKKPILNLMDNVINYIDSVEALNGSDVSFDAKILKFEVMKEKPDREILLTKIERFNNYPKIIDYTFTLKNYFSDYADNY